MSPDTNRMQLSKHEVQLWYAGPDGGVKNNSRPYAHCAPNFLKKCLYTRQFVPSSHHFDRFLRVFDL
jgi:hypothetical protein